MPLRALKEKVVGELITPADSGGLIIQPFADEKKTHAMKITDVGDGCSDEITIGDVVIIPEDGWVIVTLLEDDGAATYITIHEKLLLAVVE